MQKTTISNKGIVLREYIRSIAKFKILIFTYAKRDIKIKYSQTIFGIIWSLFQPLLLLAVFTLFFDKLIHIENNNVSYPIFAFGGIIVWQYFTFIVTSSGNSLIANQEIIKKVYFPKIILPISKTLAGMLDFTIALFLLFTLMAVLGQPFTYKLIFIPIVVAMVVIVGLSVSIWLGALTVQFRDLQHAVPYLASFGIWVTPVFYPTTLIPQPYSDWMYYINPFAVILKLFRWILISETAPPPAYFISFVGVFALLISGVYYFKKIENRIADYI